MKLGKRELLIRGLGGLFALRITVDLINDLRKGAINNHGLFVSRANDPQHFWLVFLGAAAFALFGVVILFFGSGRDWKS